MDWFGDNPWLAWLGIALILLAVEVATVDFVFLMVAGGALAAAVASALGASLPVQVVVAVVVAGLLLLLVRPLVKRHFMVAEVSHTIGAPEPRRSVGAGAADRDRERRPHQARRRDVVGAHRSRCRAV